jgi:uncharacterized RDD family membrane protein YckC
MTEAGPWPRRRRAALRAPARPGPADVIEAGAVVETVPAQYVGLVTRAIAFGLDAALINLVALLVTVVVTLALTVLKMPKELVAVAAAIGGAIYLLWIVGYFTTFWTTTGQTPGNRVMRIRVVAAGGGALRPRRAILRFAALLVAALPLFAGLLTILVDDRRRGLHDWLARTVVVEAPDDGPRAARRTMPPRAPAP